MTLAALMKRGALRAAAASALPGQTERTASAVASPAGPVISPADPDRWCWPESAAMNQEEIDRHAGRLSVFMRRGLSGDDANRLVDALVLRDREADDRRVCLECASLRGRSCAESVFAGLGRNVEQFALTLQRCPSFQPASGL